MPTVTMEEAMKRAREGLNQKDFPLQETPLGNSKKPLETKNLDDYDPEADMMRMYGGCGRGT